MQTRTRTNLPSLREPHGLREPFTTAFSGLREIQEAMESFFGDLYRGTFRERSGQLGMGCNAYVSGNTYMVECALPGVARKDIDISVDNDLLTIKATFSEHEEVKHDAFDLHELRCGEFIRELRLPIEVDPDKVDATYVDGLLRIRMGARSGLLEQRKRIEIRS